MLGRLGHVAPVDDLAVHAGGDDLDIRQLLGREREHILGQDDDVREHVGFEGALPLLVEGGPRGAARKGADGIAEGQAFLRNPAAFGLAFETPVLVVFLSLVGLVPAASMAGARRFIIFGIVVVAAVLTPPDVLSMILLSLPMIGLFEAGLIAARLLEGRKRP